VIVRVDLGPEPPAVALEEPEDCRAFHVAATGGGDLDRVAAAVGRRADGEDVYVDVDLVRRLAAGRVEPSWEQDFVAMLDFARTKGWLDESGQGIRAHVEWD
jgi:hypothetical protein